MDAQEIIKIGRKAKSDTEAFINRYLNDRGKGWPRLCFSDSFPQEIHVINEKKSITTELRYSQCY